MTMEDESAPVFALISEISARIERLFAEHGSGSLKLGESTIQVWPSWIKVTDGSGNLIFTSIRGAPNRMDYCDLAYCGEELLPLLERALLLDDLAEL
ncbi:MAG: hypothetical protein AB7L09_02300 [Nitrospira sp.]